MVLLFIFCINLTYTFAQNDTLKINEKLEKAWSLSTNFSSWYSGHCGPEIGFTYAPGRNYHIFASGKYAYYQLFQENKDMEKLFEYTYKLKRGYEFTAGFGFPNSSQRVFLRPFFQYSSFDYDVQSAVCDRWYPSRELIYCRCEKVSIIATDINVRRYGIGAELLFSILQVKKFSILLGLSAQMNIIYTSDSSFKDYEGCKPDNSFELTTPETSFYFHGLHMANNFDDIYSSFLPRFIFMLRYEL
jgi:hypothetical protein